MTTPQPPRLQLLQLQVRERPLCLLCRLPLTGDEEDMCQVCSTDFGRESTLKDKLRELIGRQKRQIKAYNLTLAHTSQTIEDEGLGDQWDRKEEHGKS